VPLYEYKCLKCGRTTEKLEHVSGPHLKKCPHCGGKVENVLSAPAIQFKGSGWYVTDYAGKSKSGPTAESGAPGGAKESGKDGADKDGASKESASKDSASKESSSKETSTKERKSAKK
jgi:putative FmdB family regulatory protein